MLPSIAKETEKIIEEYMELVDDLDRQPNDKKFKQYAQLRLQVNQM